MIILSRHVVHESGEHPDEACENDQERGVDLDLAEERSRCLDFPHDVEVGFQATERKYESHEKAEGANEPELSDGDVFGVLDDIDYRFRGPVQVEHVEDDGQVVAHEVAETYGERNRGEQDEQGDDCH